MFIVKTPASPDDVNPVEWLESSDFSWTCANNGGGESLSFFIHLKDQQGFVFFQIAFSSAGLSPLVIVSFHYTNSTKDSMISESQTFSGSDLKLNGDKSGMVIASKSSTVSLNMTKSDDGMIRYEVELALNKGLKAKFAFTAKEKPCKVGTGLFTYGKVGTTGYKLLPFGTVTGSASNSKDTLAFEGYAMVSKNEMTARADQLGVSW